MQARSLAAAITGALLVAAALLVHVNSVLRVLEDVASAAYCTPTSGGVAVSVPSPPPAGVRLEAYCGGQKAVRVNETSYICPMPASGVERVAVEASVWPGWPSTRVVLHCATGLEEGP